MRHPVTRQARELFGPEPRRGGHGPVATAALARLRDHGWPRPGRLHDCRTGLLPRLDVVFAPRPGPRVHRRRGVGWYPLDPPDPDHVRRLRAFTPPDDALTPA